MKKSSYLAGLVLGALLIACSPSTRILGSWTSPEVNVGGYDDIVVAGISENVLGRQTFEDQIQAILTADGVKATTSIGYLPLGKKMTEADKDKAISELKSAGHDAVLTVSLLDQTNESRYVPGTTYSPMMYGGYYRSFWGYYSYYSPLMYDPGYYTTDKNYFLEANLYDVNSEQLIWSAQSETTNPANLDAFAKTFAAVIADQMIKDKVIVKSK